MGNLAKKVAWFAWEFLITRFITEDVAIDRVTPGNEWKDFEIVCSLADARPGEVFGGIAEAESFSWLGFGITYRIGNFRPWSPEACRG